MVFALKMGRNQRGHDITSSSRKTSQGDIVLISTKDFNICLHPIQGGCNIQEGKVS